jgi:hypothetical protein
MLRPVHDVENVLGDAGFWTAFVVALVGTAVVWLRLRRAEWEPGIALVVVVATLAGLRAGHRLPTALVVAIGLLAFGEYLARDAARPARLAALVPGALVLAASVPEGWPFWLRVGATGAAAGGGLLAVDADQRVPRLMPLLLLVGAVGVYVCVPDTEAPKALLGALVVTAAIGLEPRVRHRVGFAAAAGLFVWVAAFGGLGRAGSVVGGIACLGVVLVIPVVRWAAGNRKLVALGVATQVALVLFVSRVAGLEGSAWVAAGLAAIAFAVAASVLLLSARAAE